ncbi:hypothetical protein BARRETLEMON_66 [Arthrobacter phage BarretLemon]|uniref:Uncharacterized protein n=1 Tax=Arthrobacter phage BarretLemon TaxID=1796994 RepID=A0A140G793_9CAUD|nr:hypothetical protein BJD79_gp66 [Arthrobacter phage BarretLemon]AMM44528.1 hypothetical protein BARRETLEMON_66 [Arthrobacter phage BarretLemon]
MSKMKDCRVPACRRRRGKGHPLRRFTRRQHSSHNIVLTSSLKGFMWQNKQLLHKGGKP